MHLRRSLAFALAAAAVALAAAAQDKLPTLALSAGIHVIQAEVANTFPSRTQGLMFRKSLAANQGMLFVFPDSGPQCMWMRNTYVPLSVAFIDEAGAILNIADMQPHSEQSHCATGPARFALEMDQGWFAKRGIKPGTKLGGLDKLKARR